MSDQDEVKPKNLGGRPSAFTQKLADTICLRLSEGESLRQICRDESMPSMSMVMRWAGSNERFREQYARAREYLLEHWAEDIIEIADDGSRDYVQAQDDEGEYERVDHDHIARARLRVDSRKWLLSKLAPKKYGERLTTELSGPGGGPIATTQVDASKLTDDQLRALASIPVHGS